MLSQRVGFLGVAPLAGCSLIALPGLDCHCHWRGMPQPSWALPTQATVRLLPRYHTLMYSPSI